MPRFPKARELGWWLVLGDTAAGEVLAMKRVGRLSTRNSNSNNTNSSSIAAEVTLLFQPPEALGDAEMTLYAVADSAMGLDVELVLPVQVVKAQPKIVDSSDGKHLLPVKKSNRNSNGNTSSNSNSSAATDFWGPASAASSTSSAAQQSGKRL
jgi:Sec63 Brl domain